MNKKQKRELLKRRRAHQKYLKYEAPLDRLEMALRRMDDQPPRCFSKNYGQQCIKLMNHAGVHEGCNERGLPSYWSYNL